MLLSLNVDTTKADWMVQGFSWIGIVVLNTEGLPEQICPALKLH